MEDFIFFLKSKSSFSLSTSQVLNFKTVSYHYSLESWKNNLVLGKISIQSMLLLFFKTLQCEEFTHSCKGVNATFKAYFKK